jgi:hypothetical protein
MPSNSLDLVRSLKGHFVLRMFKVLEWEKENMFETFAIEENQLFELAYGKLYIELDDRRILCLFKNNKRISVTISLESKDDVSKQSGEVIDSTDDKYSDKKWAKFIGQKILSIEIIKFNDTEYGNNMGMNERGIQFNFESDDFVFSQALVTNGPGSTVLMRRSDVAECYIDNLEIIEV